MTRLSLSPRVNLDEINRGIEMRMNLLDRINKGCEVDEFGCSVWKGGSSGNGRGGGYPRISFGSRSSAVHRLVYQIYYGPIPRKKQIDHTCKNRLCCNPKHLECVSAKENAKRRSKSNGY